MTSTVTPLAPPTDHRPGGSPAGRPRTERRIFLWCCGAIAVHILIDAYVDLRPGTSPTDHPISGTVPVLALAGLAWVFSRVRRWIAAMVAGQLGLAVMIAGTAPVGMLVGEGRIAPGPLSGAVGAMAGTILVGLGATMLWRHRRAGGPRFRRWGRRTGIAVLGVVVLNSVSLPIGLAFDGSNWHIGYELDEIPLGPDYEVVDLETADGLTIAAAYRPSTNGAAVIQFAGRRGDHEEMLARHGYGVFVLEPRGRHDSEGDPPFVWQGEEDLRAAVRYLQSRPDVDDGRIGGIGFSHGGLLMLHTAAREPGLRAVVSEGGTRRTFRDHIDITTATFPPFTVVATAAAMVFSDSLPPPPLPELVYDIAPRPVMFIWAGTDESAEHVATHYFERAGEPKSIWNIPESEHTGGLTARPAEYERRVIGFFDDALLR